MSRIERIEFLFHEALALPAGDERTRWIETQCREDADTLAEVLSLLQYNAAMELDPAAARPAEPFIPTAQFGAYRAVELLAQGGMSSVYRAERADGRFEQVVALKVMAGWLAGPEFLRRFDTERQLLAALNHNHITRLLDGGVSSAGDPFLITEFVRGETIDRYCDGRNLVVEARLRLFLQVCDAVDHAHRNLIVHRDLKPGNILVNDEGTVKLLDFGTASMMAERADVTLTRMRMLTPRYASPEQLRGERVSTATDVFSLGVILYELVTGAWPFGDPASMLNSLNRALADVPAKPPSTAATAESAERRSLSRQNLVRILQGDLSAIVLKALETDPARRYESVSAFAADIRNYLDGRPVLARPQTAWYRLRKFIRRRRLPAAAAALFVSGLLGSTLFAIHQAKVARAAAEKAAAEARKAEKVSDFLNDMLSSASNLSFEPGKFTVAQMLDAAQPRLETSWKGDPLVEATLRANLASSYIAVQRFDQARIQLDKALATFRALGNRLEEGKTLWLLGHLCEASSRHEESVRHYRNALEKLNGLGKAAPNLPVFRLKRNLAWELDLILNREQAEARRLIAEALEISAKDPSIPIFDLVQAQTIQAGILMEQNKFAEAEALLMRAREIGLRDGNGSSAAMPLTWLVILHGRKGNSIAARDFAGESYRLALRTMGPEHAYTALAQIMWAQLRATNGESLEALNQVQEAIPVLRKAYPPLSRNLWQGLTGAAIVSNLAGRYKEGEAYGRELIAICDAEHTAEVDSRRADSLNRLGDALLGQHRYREGMEILDRSARDFELSGPLWAKRAAQIRSKIQETRAQAK